MKFLIVFLLFFNIYANELKDEVSLKTLSDSINESYDELRSGFGKTTKFPEASKLELMMDLSIFGGNKEMHKKSTDMLDAMALRGLYDHIDGGFFRNSVDVEWEIPHFEKMLYTQAEMVSLYSRAFVTTNKELYKNIVVETIDMLDRRFLKENFYFSASDVGMNDGKGRYFVFSKEVIKNAIGKNKFSKNIKNALASAQNGNFSTMVHLTFNTNDRPKGFYEFKKELLKTRSLLEYPLIDKKINTAWNALMIEALYRASVIDKKYIEKADKHMSALKDFMFERGGLYHQRLLGHKPKQVGFLEDYSFMISALIAGYEVTFDEKKLKFAEYLLSRAKSKFYKDGIWYLSEDNLKIKANLTDIYYVSPLSKMMQNIIKLASLKQSKKYEKMAIDTLEYLNSDIKKYQANVPALAIAYLMQKKGVVTIKNSKKNLQKDSLKIQRIKYPYIVLKKDESEKYLACTIKSCFAVDESIDNIKKSIEGL